MTIGPAPMIRMEEMSVRLGIGSRARGPARAHAPAPGQNCRLRRPFREGVETAQAVAWRAGQLPSFPASGRGGPSTEERLVARERTGRRACGVPFPPIARPRDYHG